MHPSNFVTSEDVLIPACNHEIIFDSPPQNFKVNSVIKIKKNFFAHEEYFFKINKRILRAVKYKNGLLFFDISGSENYLIGKTQWNKTNLCYDLFIGTKKELTIKIDLKQPVNLRVCFLHCSHQNNTFCNKWPFMYRHNDLSENVYKDEKNFCLTRLNSPEKVTLSFAKRSDFEYIMVHSFPWTGITAFAVCTSLLMN